MHLMDSDHELLGKYGQRDTAQEDRFPFLSSFFFLFPGGTRDEAQGFAHGRQVFHHQSVFPSPFAIFNFETRSHSIVQASLKLSPLPTLDLNF